MSSKRSINNIVYGLPFQSNPFAELPKELVDSIRKTIKLGVIVVAPAGNYGPIPGTINPFAKINNLIVVGGAKNDGSDLCSFSSRGIPGIKDSGPTIVCPSEDLIGITHSGIIPILKLQEEKHDLFTRDRFEKQFYRKVFDEEWTFVQQNYVIGTGTSQSVEYLVNIIVCIIYFRNQRGFLSDTEVIKNMLINMAVPIEGYDGHEIGAGFVDYKIADDYLIKIQKGNIQDKERKFWSGSYMNSNAKFGKIDVKWFDNVNSPNQKDYTNNNNEECEQKMI